MQYRKFRSVEKEISLLGLGVMRLPRLENGKADEETGIDLIRYAVDHGVNYIDTGYTYHGGDSERIIGKALKDGYREKVLIADKLPIWLVEKEEDIQPIIEEQFSRLDVDHIDMYLIHNIVPEVWEPIKKFNVFGHLQKLKDEGRIGHIGFSFHGDYDLFTEVIDEYPWEYCQIQLNFLDKNIQAGLKGLAYARERDIDVIIMEPLKGGRLSDKVPPSVQAIWDHAAAEGIAPPERTPAHWAFKWVASQPGVSLILSGMSSFAQLDENIKIFSEDDINKMSETEYAVCDEAAAEYDRKIKYQCTKCGYCMPCPQEVEIPDVIRYLNNWYAFDKIPSTKLEYIEWLDGHASKCIHCGACEEKCPQRLAISEIMTDAMEQFGK
ncbi:MAG: aldo/keto reductase [Clostridiales bacterium]|nr:aldo/keto reductase [Clostridiales bacterium]MBQ3321668.1 aldo/keto reductase [Bacillota bacterium]